MTATFHEVNDATIASLISVAIAASEPSRIRPGADDGLAAMTYVVPDGYKIQTVDVEALLAPNRGGPKRATGTYTVRDVASFLTYYTKHAETQAETWVTSKGATAVLNAHEDATEGSPGWEDHKLVLDLKHSPEWIKWIAISNRFMSQQDFAEFLEDCVGDVRSPDMATILEVASSLQATSKAEFKSAYRTHDGQQAFRYEETIQAKAGQKGELEIPQRITLALRVYEGQQPTDIVARFRYRITPSGLALGIVIDKVSEILEQAIADVKIAIEEGIDRGDVYTGTGGNH